MAGALGNLNIELSADTVKFMSDMGRAAYAVETSVRKMQVAFGALQSAAAGLGIAVGAGAFAAGIKNMINQADELGKLSQKVGVTVENLSALKYAAELSDVSMEGLTTGLKKLATNMFEASAGGEEALRLFRGLNVEFQSAPGKLLPTDEVLLKLADKFRAMEDGAAKSALAVKLFGRNGLELIPFLNQGREGIEKLNEELKKLGGLMTGEMAKQAEQFNDNLKSISKAGDGFKIAVGNHMLPALVDMTNAMKEGIKESGILLGMWNALKAARFHGTHESDASALKSLEQKIAEVRAQMYPGNPANPALQRQYGVLVSEQAKVANRMSLQGAFDPARPNIKVQPDASAFGSEKTLKTAKETLDVGKQWNEEMTRQAQLTAEAADAMNDYNRRVREREYEEARAEGLGIDITNKTTEALRDEIKLRLENIDAQDEAEQQRMRALAGFDEHGKAIKKMAEEAKSFDFTFNSALEDAILNGEKFSNVLKAIERDIARMILRRTITEPIGAAVSGFINTGLSTMFATPRAGGGPVLAGESYLVGERGPELFVPSGSGQIVPLTSSGKRAVSGAGGGGGSTDVTINLNVQSLDPRGASSAIMANMPLIASVLRKTARAKGNGTSF